MKKIKRMIKNMCILYSIILWIKEIKYVYKNHSKYMNFTQILKKKKLIINKVDKKENPLIRQAYAFNKIINKSMVELDYGTHFVGIPKSYYTIVYYYYNEFNNIKWGNLTPNYNLFINNGIKYFIDISERKHTNYYRALNITYHSIEDYSTKILDKINSSKLKYHDIKMYESQQNLFKNIINNGAGNFLQALQMLFFIHQLCWMEGRLLVGLGCMDQYLYEYYIKDIKNGDIDKLTAKEYLKDFFMQMSKDISFHSSLIYGDTGQVAIVGGKNSNELTYVILDAFKELKIVSPKLIIKVNESTTDELLEKSIGILKNGTGSPLYMNEEIVKSGLLKYGYNEKDTENFATAACWEPLIAGKSFDMNNAESINFMKPLEKIVYDKNRMSSIDSFNTFIDEYKKEFTNYLAVVINKVSKNKFSPAALFSSLYESCLTRGLDLSEGGAVYNNFGFTSIGFANLVNALYAIKKMVFEDNIIKKEEVTTILENDFKGYENLKAALNNKIKRFGQNEEQIDRIAIDITNYYYYELKKYKSDLGGIYKPGLGTANAYVDYKSDILTNMDGHIKDEMIASNYSVEFGTVTDPIKQLISLTKVDLTKMINGSVMDMTFNYGILIKNSQSIKALLKYFITKKGQSIQFNFLDYRTLIDAKEHPEKYSNLIVRVWGMSSYFTRLPEEYQNHIIKRAMEGFSG